jgi:hypothetical protein
MKQLFSFLHGNFLLRAFPAVLLIFAASNSFAFNVTNLKATYHDGQVFLTWTDPSEVNLQYNIYRSTSKFTNSSQLTAAKLMGFVRDNSGTNIHLSDLEQQDVNYKIQSGGAPLANNQGLYVITCTGNQSYYYAVTITSLSNGSENKMIIAGQNSLSSSIAETIAQPVPVFQDSILAVGGEYKKWFVQFVNNQETPLYPAMNSTGSYGFNFYVTKRGTATDYPLVIVYEGQGGAATQGVGLDGSVTNCYIIGVYDWLPIPSGNGDIGVGDNTYFCCYHESFNIYSDEGTIPVSGVVKTFVQKRIMQAVHWLESSLPIDETRVYTKGVSATGFGALLTAVLYPKEIAAAYCTVEPMFVKPVGAQGDLYRQMWGATESALNSDVDFPSSLVKLPVYTVLDSRKMVDIDETSGLPLIFDVHGKKDKTVAWSPYIINWFDSLEQNHVGGVFYWDQRSHSGTGKNFTSEETTPDFYRYQTTKSYPAFTNCSINQNPGNGSPSSGAPYGAINGYLDWEDDITDDDCSYTLHVFVKDFYVGGVLDPAQYNTCTADVTLRRLQSFHPVTGQTIKWKNFDASNTKIQSGTILYNGGLITLSGVTINKSGNRLEFKISNCQKNGTAVNDNDSEQEVSFIKSANGYTAQMLIQEDEKVMMKTYDMMGRLVKQDNFYMSAGANTIDIAAPGSGIFLIAFEGTSFSYTGKLFF